MADPDSDDQTFEITVWDIANGDIVKKYWEADSKVLDQVQEDYGDDPRFDIQVEDNG